ncbi:MAG: hypothetical protein M3516_00460 [Actinomycetota bacterium]|nr:hypothetical protein [Actinomycetota bacterium]
MYRDSWSRAARVVAGLAAATVVIGAAPAYAQTETLPETTERMPVIDRAPARVGFDKDALIRGHLRNGAPGDTLALQRRDPNRAWRRERRASSRPSPIPERELRSGA